MLGVGRENPLHYKLRPLAQGATAHVYHLSARRRSGTSTSEKPVKLLQAIKQGPDPSLHPSHISSALPSRPRNKRFIPGTSRRSAAPEGERSPAPSRSTQKSLFRPFRSPFHPCARAPIPQPPIYSSAKAASIRPVKHKCTTHAQCSSITHATRARSESASSNRRSQLGQRLRIEKARGSKRRGRMGGGVGAFLLTRACLVFSQGGSGNAEHLCRRSAGKPETARQAHDLFVLELTGASRGVHDPARIPLAAGRRRRLDLTSLAFEASSAPLRLRILGGHHFLRSSRFLGHAGHLGRRLRGRGIVSGADREFSLHSSRFGGLDDGDGLGGDFGRRGRELVVVTGA